MGLSTSHSSPFLEKNAPGGLAEHEGDFRALLASRETDYITLTEYGSLKVAEAELVAAEAELIVRVGGSLARVRTGLEGEGGGGGIRGAVVGFSSSSRRRLMRLIASLERDKRPVFVTLTYPDIFPDDMGKWKRDIDVFGKRLARKWADAGFIWRIEFKERKTGESVGKIAPHFHILVYGTGYRDLLGWVPMAWWKVVGSGSDNHLRAGTRVEHVYSWGGIMRYVGKYIAKIDDYPKEWLGRAWGVIGRKNLPWAVEVIISLTPDESIKLVRLGRKMIRAKRRSFVYGLTWIVNVERVLDYLEFLSDVA